MTTAITTAAVMTSSSSQPAIVIVGGGWHTPASYGKLRAALEAAGHEVHCPATPSVAAARLPVAGLAEDTAALRALVGRLVDGGRRVVALAHSYGGQVASNALHGLGVESRKAQGLAGGVAHIIYLCAFALPEGGSMFSKVKEMGHEELMPIAFDFADNRSVLCRDAKAQLVQPCDEEAADAYVADLELWNGQCMYDGISHCAWREMPMTYIYTTADMTVPYDYQNSMVALLESQGCSVTTYELEAGHCPNLTATNEVADVVNKVLSAL